MEKSFEHDITRSPSWGEGNGVRCGRGRGRGEGEGEGTYCTYVCHRADMRWLGEYLETVSIGGIEYVHIAT